MGLPRTSLKGSGGQSRHPDPRGKAWVIPWGSDLRLPVSLIDADIQATLTATFISGAVAPAAVRKPAGAVTFSGTIAAPLARDPGLLG